MPMQYLQGFLLLKVIFNPPKWYSQADHLVLSLESASFKVTGSEEITQQTGHMLCKQEGQI